MVEASTTKPPVNDTHRPRYHFLPPANWMNDPNGLIQWRGVYHMFYQYNPYGASWGAPHWGHATSSDLVHWADEPLALVPDANGYDAQGCWSGCAVDDDGVPTIIYTGVAEGRQRPCLATSHDGLRTWQKDAGNPLFEPPAGLDLVGAGGKVDFRDHALWREDGLWYQLIAAGIRDVGGTALLFSSPDLRHWTYLHPLCTGDLAQREPTWTGKVWECPQLLRFDGGDVLIVSSYHEHGRHTVAMSGRYAERRFTPARMQPLDEGYLYAPQALTDERGRVIMWGWLQEGRSALAQQADGWSGVMSLPRVLSLAPDGALLQQPAPELAALRRVRHALDERQLPGDEPVALDSVRGDALELRLRIDTGSAWRCGVALRCAPDGSERAVIAYDHERQRLSIDATRASLSDEADNDERGGPLALAPGEPLELQIFLDRSVIEVFANGGRACLSGRVYPTRPDSLGVALFAQGGAAQLREGEAWELATIWPADRDPLTA